MNVRGNVSKRRLGAATFAPIVTASTWKNAYQSAWDRASKAHGQVTARSGWTGKTTEAPPGMLIAGTSAPRITNAEAVTLIRGFRAAASGVVQFALWYAYAAIAYGWDPPDADELDAAATRGASSYLPDVTVALWVELYRVAMALDAANEPVRLALDDNFTDPAFVAELRSQLTSEGADALFKVPLPWCTDRITKKRRVPYPPCDDDGNPPVDPITRKRNPPVDPITRKRYAKCDKPGDCEVETIDDPITAVVKAVLPLAAIVVAIWLLSDNRQPRRTRRSTRN